MGLDSELQAARMAINAIGSLFLSFLRRFPNLFGPVGSLSHSEAFQLIKTEARYKTSRD